MARSASSGISATATPGRIGVKARDVLIVLAESAAEVLAASLRALSNMTTEPIPAARALETTYDRYANELAEIEAAYRNRTGSPVR